MSQQSVVLITSDESLRPSLERSSSRINSGEHFSTKLEGGDKFLCLQTLREIKFKAEVAGITVGDAVDAILSTSLQGNRLKSTGVLLSSTQEVAVEEESEMLLPTTLSVSETIAKVLVSKFNLEVTTSEAAFVCGIYSYMRISKQLTLEEEDLERIHQQVQDAALDGKIDVVPRSQFAISRLRKQGLLERADSKGMASFGEYTLSSLAMKLRDDIFEREALTKRNLRVLIKQVLAELSLVRQHAAIGGSQAFWNENVTSKMRILVGDVLRGIIQRQKGLEAEQSEVRTKILALLRSDNWKSTSLECSVLLDRTSATLEELHTILLEEMASAQNLLLEISDLADTNGQEAASTQAGLLQDQIDSIGMWSENFKKTWSSYYTKIHEYIRFMVKFDPQRQIMGRLRESIREYGDRPWHFLTSTTDPTTTIREDMAPPVLHEIVTIEIKTQSQAIDRSFDADTLLDSLTIDAQTHLDQHGTLLLSEFLATRMSSMDDDTLFMAIGHLQAWLMEHKTLKPRRSDQWVTLRDNIELQDVAAVDTKILKEKGTKA